MDDFKERWNRGLVWLAVLWGAILLWGLLAGCSAKRVAVREVLRDTVRVSWHDTIHDVRVERDTVRLKDSVAVTVKETGETIRVAMFRDRWRDRWRHDTVVRTRTDTVYKVQAGEKEKVTVREPWWMRVVQTGWPVVAVLAVWGCLRALRRIKI